MLYDLTFKCELVFRVSKQLLGYKHLISLICAHTPVTEAITALYCILLCYLWCAFRLGRGCTVQRCVVCVCVWGRLKQRERANLNSALLSVSLFFSFFFFLFANLSHRPGPLRFPQPHVHSTAEPDQSPRLADTTVGVHWTVPACGATSFGNRVRLDFIFGSQCFSEVGFGAKLFFPSS